MLALPPLTHDQEISRHLCRAPEDLAPLRLCKASGPCIWPLIAMAQDRPVHVFICVTQVRSLLRSLQKQKCSEE